MASAGDKFYRGRITQREDFAADLWKIKIDPGGAFEFAAGQFATLGVESPAKRIERAYSIVSSPYERELEIFIELVEQGELTPLLHKLHIGDELSVRRIAKGRFTLDFKSGHRNHLLLATVTGVAPYVSYVRTLYSDWKEDKFPGDLRLFIIQGASRSWEFGYREELERIASEVPWLTYVPTVSRPWEDAAWRGETGRAEDIIRKYTSQWDLDPAETTGYLCGHPQMIDLGRGILQRSGFAKQSLREEVYWIPPRTNPRS
ncbi:MAG: FAD-binding oxidoreductase [Candidatus Acidiferrales bacterium]